MRNFWICSNFILTESDDVTSPYGVDKALQIIASSDNASGLLWGSLPCTGGTGWWDVNLLKPGGGERLDLHLEALDRLLDAWDVVASAAFKKGWAIAFGWPAGCKLWNYLRVKQLMEKFRFPPNILSIRTNAETITYFNVLHKPKNEHQIFKEEAFLSKLQAYSFCSSECIKLCP